MKHAPDFFRSADAAAVPFHFGQSAAVASAAMPALDRINERFVRRARAHVESLARCRANVVAEAVVTRRFGDWQAGQGDATIASLYALAPMKGTLLLAFSPDMLRILLDRYFGGTANRTASRATELTPSEERFLTRLANGLIAALGDAWSRSLAVEPVLRSRETNLAYAAPVGPDEGVAVCAYRVELATGAALGFSLLYPVAGLRSIERLLADPTEEEPGEDNSAWHDSLVDALAGIRFDARTVLARPQISLERLMSLAVGDVLPVTLTPEVPMIVADRTIAMGTMGDANGCAALQISRMLNRKVGQ